MPEELSSKRNAWRSSVAEAPPLEPATAPYSSSNWLSKASTSSLNSSVPEAGATTFGTRGRGGTISEGLGSGGGAGSSGTIGRDSTMRKAT